MGRLRSRSYSDEFKEQAVDLAEEVGNYKAAKKLGVSAASIGTWRDAREGKVRSKDASPEAELERLRRENDELRKINHILKRAAAFFSQDHLK